MPSLIPFEPGDPEQILEITLDDVPYVLRARWNTRDAAWYLDAWEGDGTTPIAFGVKLVLGVFLGRTFENPLFSGGLFMLPEAGSADEAGLDDLGGRVQLVHLTAADFVLMSTTPLSGTSS